MTTTAAVEEREPLQPANMDEARRWIATLREAYNRETAYRERLEAELHRQRDVVEFARYWHKARGMHRAPWLSRLRDAVVALEDKLATERTP